MTSDSDSVPSRLRLTRCNSPASALVASALRSETSSRSGPAGLTTKSVAPARMAETTLSMPPWAVCTITGVSRPAWRIRAITPRPSRSGITRSSTTQSTWVAVVADQERKAGIAAVGGQRAVAETLHHGLNQTTLYRIVIDDQHDFRHEHSQTPAPARAARAGEDLCRFGAVSAIGLNGLLNASRSGDGSNSAVAGRARMLKSPRLAIASPSLCS